MRERGAGHPARAVLRPRLRARAHAVHGADGERADLGRARARRARARACSGGRGSATPGSPASSTPRRASSGFAMFGAMAAFLVVALCVPQAFGDEALLFACSYGAVRAAQIALFTIASRDEPGLRRSVNGLAASTAMGVGLLIAGASAGGPTAGRAVGARARARHGRAVSVRLRGLEAGSRPLRRAPRPDRDHRPGRVDRRDRRRAPEPASTRASSSAAVLGIVGRRRALVAVLRRRRARRRAPARRTRRRGRERNEIARDSFSYLHFPMVAGIVLLALGLKKTLGHVDEPLKLVPAVALLGGTAFYLLAHVAFRLAQCPPLQRAAAAVRDRAGRADPGGGRDPRAGHARRSSPPLLVALIVYEACRFADLRDRLRHGAAAQPVPD